MTSAVVACAVLAGAAAVLWHRCGLEGCPDVSVLEGYVHDDAPVVLDRHGREVARLYRIDRAMVPLDSLPPYVPEAFVAIEDQRFWRHRGIDLRRVPAALLANLRAGRIRQGSSTITMQLARNVFPDRLPYHRRSIGRKLAEMRVARMIEARYSKEQILELYVNHVYFGNGAWGIDAAARTYFGKPATRLDLGEAALLAGTVAAPRLLDPGTPVRYIYGRRFVVLQTMARYGAITREEADTAARAPLLLAAGALPPGRVAPYFVQAVRRLLERELGEALYTSGYVIRTTLDPAVQAAVEAELARAIAAVEAGEHGRYEHPVPDGPVPPTGRGAEYLQGAGVVMEAATGDVLALVGGRDFAASRYDRALLARRQPASTFKPIVYAAALSTGRSPATPLDDSRIERRLAGGVVWRPRNHDGVYATRVTLRDALVRSSNTATIRLAEAVGLDRVAATAERLGLRGPFPLVPALALGTAEATLLELVAAYGAFATLGWRAEPRLVARVEDREGRVVWRADPAAERVLDPAAAFMLTDVLRDAVDRGTGRGVRDAGFRGPAAGKTGTSHDAADLWFVGYTPGLVAGVWIGFDYPKRVAPDATAETVAAPLWGRIMRRTAPPDEAPWQPPAGVVARLVGPGGGYYEPGCALAGAARIEYFHAARAPAGSCAPALPTAPVVGPAR